MPVSVNDSASFEEKEKIARLFDYIAKVLSVDLPVIRNLLEYKEQLWWLSDIPIEPSCQLRKLDLDEAHEETLETGWWLKVKKTKLPEAPSLPNELQGWVELDISNPTKPPAEVPVKNREISFYDDPSREKMFSKYLTEWRKQPKTQLQLFPEVHNVLKDWVEIFENSEETPKIIEKKNVLEQFEDDPKRTVLLQEYKYKQWEPWAKSVLPSFRANQLYSELFALHQILQIDSERIEFLFGHALFTWKHKQGDIVNHPLFLTPIEINFNAQQRTISLLPSVSLPTTPEFDCLRDLEYDNMVKIAELNESLSKKPPDVWDNKEMCQYAQSITGLISPDGVNKYEEAICANPLVEKKPTIWNAPVFFVRPRARHFWVQDAEQVRDAVKGNDYVPWFIRALTAKPPEKKPLDTDDENIGIGTIPEGELLLPLPYNDEQKDVVQRLRNHSGVLVQGPPGTGKSHTIANIICSLLAQGKRILVTAQTERALKVLRDKIPKEIQNLCVSQLGSDIESRNQIKGAVQAICGRLGKGNNPSAQAEIEDIRRRLRITRERQVELRNAIRKWVEINFETLSLGIEKIDAVKAAQEVSENQREHDWLPDKLSPSDEPPLTKEELEELCELLSQIKLEDREALSKKFLTPQDLPSPGEFEKVISSLQGVSQALIKKTKESGISLVPDKLKTVSPDFINEVSQLSQDASTKLCQITEGWQHEMLRHLFAQGNQRALWHDFYEHAYSLVQSAWPYFQKVKSHKINFKPTQTDTVFDYHSGIEHLRGRLRKGKKLKGWLVRLPKEANVVLNNFEVDGQRVATMEHLDIVQAHIHYGEFIQKFGSLWARQMVLVNGPALKVNDHFPLRDFEEKLTQVKEVLDWEEKFGTPLGLMLETLDIQQYSAYPLSELEKLEGLLKYQCLNNEHKHLKQILDDLNNVLTLEDKKTNTHPLWRNIRPVSTKQDLSIYQEAYNEVKRLEELRPKVEKLEKLLGRLREVAPLWAQQLENEAKKNKNLIPPEDWQTAWRWSRLNSWLEGLHKREDMDSLLKKLEVEQNKESQLVKELVATLTWQRQIERVSPAQQQALIAWSQAMSRYGRGTGKHAQYHLATARKEMYEAQKAVPVWIMPLHRVVGSFYPPRPDMFDVIIVDEASQCDLRALPVLYRGSKVLLVGDLEQISPESIGISHDKVFQLIRQHLREIPHAERYDLQSSLYHIAELRLPTRIFLKEHFRSVPEIIEFSNHHIYVNDRIEPLRVVNPGNALLPPLDAIYVPKGFKNENNDVNEPEAEALVDKLVACCKDAKYHDKTMGIISLLGEPQAKHIDRLLRSRIDEGEIERRNIICGDAYSFQGDERDVMFLSLVVASNAKFAPLANETAKRRFNVAASRARDQVFLFYSASLQEITNKDCMRYKLLDWYLNHRTAEKEAGLEVLKKKAESTFEIDVGRRIIERGFKVIPQYEVLTRKRIDLVVQGKESRLAVECDGDRHHGLDKWEADQRREEQLRRAGGWIFWRVTASAFHRNPDKALSSLWEKLKELKIEPYS